MPNGVSQIEDLEKFILIQTKRFFNNESKIEYVVTPRTEYEKVFLKRVNAPSNMKIYNDKFAPKIQSYYTCVFVLQRCLLLFI